jgi:RND family efflux transporter MFP subunit
LILLTDLINFGYYVIIKIHVRRDSTMKKKIWIGSAVIFGIFLLWRIYSLIFSSGRESGRPVRPPVAVEVGQVSCGRIIEAQQLTGTVYPQYQYIIAPKVSGRILQIRKRIGDHVSRGELVAVIDDAEYQQTVFESEANLRIAQASMTESQSQFELAAQEKERAEQLQAKGIASPAELDAAVTNYTAQESRYALAQAQVEQREAALKSARIRLGYTRLTASKPGFIGERFVDEGALLAPNTAVASVVGIDSVIIRTTVIERDYSRIRIGQKASVTVDAFQSRQFSGIVSRIAPMLQEASRVAQMEVEVRNDSLLLKPGMFARVQVVTAAKDSAQIVPAVAVVNRNGETGVFTVNQKENLAEYVPVRTGIVTLDRVEILSPSLAGPVVTLGQHLLENGSPVLLSGNPEKTGTEEKNP